MFVIISISKQPETLDKTKSRGLGWDENRLSCYNIGTKGALLLSITVKARLNLLGLLDLLCSLMRINSKI